MPAQIILDQWILGTFLFGHAEVFEGLGHVPGGEELLADLDKLVRAVIGIGVLTVVAQDVARRRTATHNRGTRFMSGIRSPCLESIR